MTTLFVPPKAFYVQSSNTLLGQAKLYFFQATTFIDQTVYTTSALNVPHPQPVQADTAGIFPAIYLDPNAVADYRVQLKTSSDVLVYDEDNYPKSGGDQDPTLRADLANTTTAGKGSDLVSYRRTSAENSTSIVASDFSFDRRLRFPVDAFGAVGDSTTDDTQAFIKARNVANVAGGLIELGPKTYKISSQLLFSVANTGMVGQGWASRLLVDSAATRFAPILVQSPTFAELKGMLFRDFCIDGNLKGALHTGLLQINNGLGLVQNLRVCNGGTPGEASPDGVDGIAISIGSLDAAGQPQMVVDACLVENVTKSSFYVSTQARNVRVSRCVARNGTGSTVSTGFGVLGGLRVIISDCIAEEMEGNCFSIDTSDQGGGVFRMSDGSGLYNCIARRSGTGSTAGHGFFINNVAGQANPATKFVLANCQAIDCGVVFSGNGIRIAEVDDVVVSNPLVVGARNAGIGVQNARRVSITGGEVRDCNVANVANISGIYVQTTGSAVVDMLSVQSVQFKNSAGSHQKYPIFFDGSNPAGSVTRFTFLNNPSSGHESSDFPNTVLPKSMYFRHRWSVTTTDATPTNAGTFTLEDNSTYHIEAKISGMKSDGTDRAKYHRECLAYRNGGGASVQGAIDTIGTDRESNAAWDANIAVPGGNVVTYPVTGVAATTITWPILTEIVAGV